MDLFEPLAVYLQTVLSSNRAMEASEKATTCAHLSHIQALQTCGPWDPQNMQTSAKPSLQPWKSKLTVQPASNQRYIIYSCYLGLHYQTECNDFRSSVDIYLYVRHCSKLTNAVLAY